MELRTVADGNVVDELHDEHSLADTGTAEETNLTSLAVGGEKIHDLDSSLENLLLDAHLDELGGLTMDGKLAARIVMRTAGGRKRDLQQTPWR